MIITETKNVILELRTKKGLSQEELAEKVFVTRQAVSRWETGETQPNTETLKLLSKEFDVSINTLLGSPRKLVCQCCGMHLEGDEFLSREPDESMEKLVDYLAEHMSNENWKPEQVRAYFNDFLPKLKHWEKAE